MGKGGGQVEGEAEQEVDVVEDDLAPGMEWDGMEEAHEAAEKVRDKFENEVRNICATIELLVVARRDTIAKLLRAAGYLDSVWLRCRVGVPTIPWIVPRSNKESLYCTN